MDSEPLRYGFNDSPSNLAESVTPLRSFTSATAEVSAALRGAAAPFTVKAASGSAWNATLMARSGSKSCIQATRPRNVTGAPFASVWRMSPQAPSSLRVSVTLCAVVASANAVEPVTARSA